MNLAGEFIFVFLLLVSSKKMVVHKSSCSIHKTTLIFSSIKNLSLKSVIPEKKTVREISIEKNGVWAVIKQLEFL